MSDQDKPGTDLAPVPALSPGLAQQFADMAMMVPDETGDANDNIVGAILAAEHWDDLDAPWESSGAEKLAGKRLLIHTIMRRPSDYRDGLGVFLVAHYTDTESGEAGVFTSSSVSIVAQLVRAYAAGWLPLYAEIVVAARRTKAGYLPHHLKVTGIHATPAADEPAF